MFWTIMLAHILADYPLQPYKLVLAKRRLPGLLLHVAIHFVTMVVLLWSAIAILWPYLLVITIIHFLIDAFKNWLSVVRPELINGPYILDQCLHILSLVVVTAWITQAEPAVFLPEAQPWQIISLGIVLVTFAWHVTERIMMHTRPEYVQELNLRLWPRMFTRGIMYVLVLLAGSWLQPQSVVSAAGVIGVIGAIGFVQAIPYIHTPYRQRELTTDIIVSLIVGLFILWAL